MSTDTDTNTGINLPAEESGWVRLALLHGMAAVAEIERLSDAVEFAKACKIDVPDYLRPARPDALASVLPNMVSALHVVAPASTIGGSA
jgi:hypothetical protein